MSILRNTLATLFVAALPMALCAQNGLFQLPAEKKAPQVLVPGGSVNLNYNGTLTLFPVASNANYTLTPVWGEGETPWFNIKPYNEGGWKISGDYWYMTEPRVGKIAYTLSNGATGEISVVQSGNNSASLFKGDAQVKVSSATASSQNSSSEGIAKTYDGSTSTYYHSVWSGGSTKFPVTLTYTFADAPEIDYVVYTPRQDSENGNFGRVSISYSTTTAPNTYVTVVDEIDLGYSGNSSTISLGEEGIKNVKNVKFTVHNGKNNFATCAEMEFFARNTSEFAAFEALFTNDLCYELKPGITETDVAAAGHPFARQLGFYLLSGKYDTNYRVAEFEAYETVATLSARLKTTQYNRYENPTGIYFEKGATAAIFAEGISDAHPVNLIIKDFGDSNGQPESTYALRNGLNVINVKNFGNGYVSYYTDDYANAPKIKLHFALSKVNGYFDQERGDTNEDWVNLLANACSNIIDMRTKNLQVAFPTARFKSVCPRNGVELANNLNNTVALEREIMGLEKYGVNPKNRQFARVVWGGFMFADGIGAAANDNSVDAWMQPSASQFEFWGLAHELGHNNQLTPGFKWSGCGETTNNIYSAWVQFNLGPGWYRLESEVSGEGHYGGLKGGRFNCYLEQGVRQGISWQLQKGPDYGYPTDKVTVANQDYDGRVKGDTTVISGNYDHFVKLVPMWQLQLYCHQAGFSPDVYAKLHQAVRTGNYSGLTNGQMQMRFMKTICDSTRLDFTEFFEKAGMLRPINAYIQDYSPGWNKINEAMIQEFKSHVAAQGYPKPEGEVNYISALNWKTYADRLPLSGTLNDGCTKTNNSAKGFVKVLHSKWKNVVAFETYDAEDKLLRITMQGLGGDNANSYTQVMWPNSSTEKAAYIMAVGWDGTRMKCYEE